MGLLMHPEFQWLDAVGPIDFLTTMSHGFMNRMASAIPKEILDKAPIMNWFYVADNLKPIQAYAGPPMTPSHTFETCPPLDYLVIPGTDPAVPLSAACIKFLKERYADERMKGMLIVCSGSMSVAQAGILDGLNVCSNKFALRMSAQAGVLNRKVKWVGNRRWIVDGKIWSAAGVTAGIDLTAEFMRVNFDEKLVKLVMELSEYSPLPDQPDAFAYILEGVDLA
ncbi:class I glutamine amidotransferase-like protein [Agrocybe pediades]|nr:class I glutamine amidotransferase-like protein [Agrocybe pediades]